MSAPGRAPGADSSFVRRNRQQGGSNRSYSSNVSAPAYVAKERQETLIASAIGLFCPPVAMAYYWFTGRFELRVRILVTVALFLLTTLYFSWLIPVPKPETYQPQTSRPQAVTEYSPSSSAGGTGAE